MYVCMDFVTVFDAAEKSELREKKKSIRYFLFHLPYVKCCKVVDLRIKIIKHIRV